MLQTTISRSEAEDSFKVSVSCVRPPDCRLAAVGRRASSAAYSAAGVTDCLLASSIVEDLRRYTALYSIGGEIHTVGEAEASRERGKRGSTRVGPGRVARVQKLQPTRPHSNGSCGFFSREANAETPLGKRKVALSQANIGI